MEKEMNCFKLYSSRFIEGINSKTSPSAKKNEVVGYVIQDIDGDVALTVFREEGNQEDYKFSGKDFSVVSQVGSSYGNKIAPFLKEVIVGIEYCFGRVSTIAVAVGFNTCIVKESIRVKGESIVALRRE